MSFNIGFLNIKIDVAMKLLFVYLFKKIYIFQKFAFINSLCGFVCALAWACQKEQAVFKTELLETLVRVALSCAPGAAFVLADISTVEWADKTAEY